MPDTISRLRGSEVLCGLKFSVTMPNLELKRTLGIVGTPEIFIKFQIVAVVFVSF